MGGARGRPVSYGRGESVAENTGRLLLRCHPVGRAARRPISGTWPGSEIAQTVQTSSSCSSTCTCVSATVCPRHSVNAPSKAQWSLGWPLVTRFAVRERQRGNRSRA